MTIETTTHKRCSVLKITGRVDSSNADELHDAFKAIHKEGTHNIIFDMTDVNFMSSRGLWVLIETQKASKAKNGELALFNVSENIIDSLNLTGMKDYFKLHDDLSKAVGSF